MPTLNVRKLPDAVHAKLRLRAARAGRSMEAEARAILVAACENGQEVSAPEDLQALVDDLYARRRPRGVSDALLRERRHAAARE